MTNLDNVLKSRDITLLTKVHIVKTIVFPVVMYGYDTAATAKSLQSCPTLCYPMNCSTPAFPVHHYLPEFAQIHVHWIKDAIQPSHPLLPFFSCHQSFPASGSFPMYWHFPSGSQSIRASALSTSPSNEYLRLISFRIDWFDLLAVHGTLKSILQHHSSKASILGI